MPVNTLTAAAHITPVVIRTFLSHSKRKGKKLHNHDQKELSTDDILFDEAFHIVRAFIALGTNNTVESLQAFTNTHVPAPYWCAVSPVRIPLFSANRAADDLIKWFGPEELRTVVGGERWWQVRGLDGIDAEWITEREYLSPPIKGKEKMSEADKDILRMEHLDSVMLYIHGGGYFWGSINTHRYQIIRYARKIKGRCFAVNYRKAPQYPWPCPLQDVLAAYFYLTRPPPEAHHAPILPSQIVFAGDSAGGGLALAVLTILRDLHRPQPAGAVLISPWVDLTHSFPSVMGNTESDIVPPHGFLAKPSVLWPVELVAEKGRVVRAEKGVPPVPGHADTLKPGNVRKRREGGMDQEKMAEEAEREGLVDDNGKADEYADGAGQADDAAVGIPDKEDIDFWQPKPPKVLMDNPRAVPLEMRSQIQMYAATEQLSHPLVSPVLQGSLGGLCPLYIMAGDGEVLRDEIVYIAHRAAHPADYPARAGVMRDGRRQRENAERWTEPTRVHLQVFDGMCHVLTVFTFTPAASYAYRSIAEFVRHVTQNDAEHLAVNPFPELHRPPLDVGLSADVEPDHDGRHEAAENAAAMDRRQRSDVDIYKLNERELSAAVGRDDEQVDMMPENGNGDAEHVAGTQEAGSGSQVGDIPDVLMLRERVDVHGIVRPMEAPEDCPVLKIRPEEVGLLKEGPLNKWWSGQKEWDRKFKRSAERAQKQRLKHEAVGKRIMENAREQGLLLVHEAPPERLQPPRLTSNMSSMSSFSRPGRIDNERRWGPLDLEGENVPLSAIANRRDTPEALALLKKSIYRTAPVTHQNVPKMKMSDIIRAAFDPNDDPNGDPKQSVSEQQVRSYFFPNMHGLRMWDSVISIFMRSSSKSAKKAREAVKAQARVASGALSTVTSPDASSR
ncbi:alpha/beta-hydrolase [Athelia psychrophila]|uniref:Alpha/beta-hydrolase n=1 Tax=Athelia psychrophila TaxID=1759441 RepID=A0A166N749_9AGAM|nr:alpha/beta-hydrolase [Fibularhizoctonia sp. CBS 109695]